MAKAKAPAAGMKTYILTMHDDSVKRITLPASWKCTFGPLIPGSKETGYNTNGAKGTALRFYEGRDKQRAVFVGVQSFRDSSIVFEEQIENRHSRSVDVEIPGAGSKTVVAEAVTREWRDVDNPGPAPVAPDLTRIEKLAE